MNRLLNLPCAPAAADCVRQAVCRLALAIGTAALAACSPGEQAESASHEVPRPASVTESVTVRMCDEDVQYDTVPERVVTHDVNITELFLYLGLGDRLVGYSGIPVTKAIAPEFREQLDRVPNLSSREMNLETIVGAQADFVFGGWSYGFREGGVTPQVLRNHGIQSYVLTESCIRKVARERASVQDTFADMLNLGRIFRVEAHADALVARAARRTGAYRCRAAGRRIPSEGFRV